MRARALALLVPLVAGCGGGAPDPSGEDGAARAPVGIRYMRWADPSEIEATRVAIERFHELHPDIRVKLEYTSFGQYGAKLQTLIAGRDAPDVFALSGLWFHDLARRDALTDLGPLIDRDPAVDLLDYFSAPLEIYRHGDAIYGLPRDFNVIALFYNRDHFDEAGVAYPDSSWSWSDLRAAAKTLTRDTNGDGRTDRWGIQVSNDMEVCWGNYVFQNGGAILDADRRLFRLDAPEAIEAIDFLRALIHEDRVSPSPLDMESLSGTPFRNGRLAMITSGSWTLAKLDATERFRYGVAPLPRGERRAAVANGVANAISASTKERDAAWALVRFLSGPEGQRLLARSGTSIPALRAVAESDDFLAAGRPDVDRRVFLESMTHAHTLPFTPALSRWGGEVIKALDTVWLDERSPQAAMRDVAPKVNAILARAYAESGTAR